MRLMCGIVLGRLALGTPSRGEHRQAAGASPALTIPLAFFQDFSGVM
jgi:hypothetical protein